MQDHVVHLLKQDYHRQRQAFEAGEVTCRALMEALVDRLEKYHSLNVYITPAIEKALAAADIADQNFRNRKARPLEGLSLAMKDNFCTQGVATTAGSRFLENFIPPYESTISRHLFAAGGIMVGKANMDEFAMGSSTENSYFGPSMNPWRSALVDTPLAPGGSSGGSAAAVASGLAVAATGTDTGGSIRQPAAFCGVVGLKPTYGRCSRWGIIAFASSLDQAGPMTRSVRDAALLLEIMGQHDPKDSTSVQKPVSPYSRSINTDLRGLKIGIPVEYNGEGIEKATYAAWQYTADWLRDAGAKVEEVSLPLTRYGLSTYYIIAPAEMSSNLARYDGIRYGRREVGTSLQDLYKHSRTKGFGEEVKRRILVGTYVLSANEYEAYYLYALKVRRRIAEEMLQQLEKVDVLLTPTSPTSAFALGEKTADPVQMYLSDIFTVGVNLAGVPALSVPVGLNTAQLPLGMQIIGRPFAEQTLFNVGCAIEERANFQQYQSLLDKSAHVPVTNNLSMKGRKR